MRKDLFLDFLLIKDHFEINSEILAFRVTKNVSHVFNNHCLPLHIPLRVSADYDYTK